MAVYYKVRITKGTEEATVYWTESYLRKVNETLDILDKNAKIDAIEMEMILKKMSMKQDTKPVSIISMARYNNIANCGNYGKF